MAAHSERLWTTAFRQAQPEALDPRLRGAACAGAGGLAALGAMAWRAVAIADWVTANPWALFVGDRLVIDWVTLSGQASLVAGLALLNLVLAAGLAWQTHGFATASPPLRIAVGALAAAGIAAAAPPLIVCLAVLLNIALWAALIALCTVVALVWFVAGLIARLFR